MIRAHGRSGLGQAAITRSLVPPRARQAASLDHPEALALAPDRLAIEVVRHLNGGDLEGFRRVVGPSVTVTAALTGAAEVLDARRLFTRLTTLAPRQTLCASRIRSVDADRARVDLEIAWLTSSGRCISSLGTLDLVCAGGVVTTLILDLDVDPALGRAAAELGAQSSRGTT
jgi:hypothetical protein